jgi:hypothetical protein
MLTATTSPATASLCRLDPSCKRLQASRDTGPVQIGRTHPASKTRTFPDKRAAPNIQQPAATKPPTGIFEPASMTKGGGNKATPPNPSKTSPILGLRNQENPGDQSPFAKI